MSRKWQPTTGGGTANIVELRDPTTTTQKMAINAAGRLGIEVHDGTTDAQKLAIDSNGKIGVNALPNVTIGAEIPAGTKGIGSVSLDDTKTLSYAAIDITTATTTAVIAATAAQKIKIVKLFFVTGGANNIQLLTAATALTGAMNLAANEGFGFDGEQAPIICGTNEAFNITTSAAENVDGMVIYYKE